VAQVPGDEVETVVDRRGRDLEIGIGEGVDIEDIGHGFSAASATAKTC
jgi:hypothetical protein